MATPPIPFPTLDELVRASKKNKRFKASLEKIIEIFLESYKKGHQSYDKQKAYVGVYQELVFLDRALVDIFNELTYRQG